MKGGFKLFDIAHGDVAALNDVKGDFGFDAETRLVRYVSAECYLGMVETHCFGRGDGELRSVLLAGCGDGQER